MKVYSTQIIVLIVSVAVCLPQFVASMATPILKERPFSLKIPSVIPPSETVSKDNKYDDDDGILACLFGSETNRDIFFQYYFGTKSPVHIHRDHVELNSPLQDLVSSSAASLLQDLFETCPYITLRQHGEPKPVDKSIMTWETFQEYIQQGCSAVIPVVQEERFQSLKSSLEQAFQKSVSMTIYHSGPNASALLPHIDAYDVFVIQLEGHKDWEIVQGHAATRQATSFTLQPGDVLYIPHNVIHSAKTTHGFDYTTHLTIGLLTKWKAENTLEYSNSINQET